MPQHTLILGGTGMLADFSVAMGERTGAVTSMARTERSLAALDDRMSTTRCAHRTVALDYQETEQFRSGLVGAVEAAGPVDLVVGWFHDDCAPVVLATELGAMQHPFAFFHVMGSAAGDPAAGRDALRQRVEAAGPIVYRQIVLGFIREGAHSRWLANTEISEGVGRAVELNQPFHVVGTISPWEERP